ncbi:bacillaene synthase trans-acting acyltransferase [Acetitomaculum ruminis DSM 5522]|uniref:Bacillaene synthase trans-acting acyltransferase n=1 Tax=Acetitomaculum ruminis DSM 5522 TaxID=1120918 RepID=A0A1I0V657_9FIRM|nr:acyltransferase domain-containing protein [Acetitomaculum ruminis]SFA71026.1 bacillaene synthase trans-acting acyltransferase [Acetitomaculum ruminis DSM 5522]
MAGKNVFLFGGQGSAVYQMGLELYNEYEDFKRIMDEFEDIYQKEMGFSLLNEIFKKENKKPLDDITFTHPGIFAVEYALFSCLSKKIYPDLLLGSSLGEFSSMAASGIISKEEGFLSVIEQARLIKNSHIKGELISVFLKKRDFLKLEDEIDAEIVANNCSKILILATLNSNEKKVKEFITNNKMMIFETNVHFPFHSSYIDSMKEQFTDKISKKLSLKPGNIPILSCSKECQTLEYKREDIWNIIRNPMNLPQIIENNIEKSDLILDLSPNSMMEVFVKDILGRDTRIKGICKIAGSSLKRLEDILNIYQKEFC